jgi:hypothetical protein
MVRRWEGAVTANIEGGQRHRRPGWTLYGSSRRPAALHSSTTKTISPPVMPHFHQLYIVLLESMLA